MESGHDHLPGLLTPGEVPGSCGGEDLGDGALKLGGNLPAVIEEVPVLIFLFPLPCPEGPGVILAGVVHHKVQAHHYILFVAGPGQLRQILHGAQLRLNLPEVGNGVAAVTAARRALQQGHQMQVVDAGLAQVVQMLPGAPEGSAEALGVGQHSVVFLIPVPVGSALPLPVQSPQVLAALQVRILEHFAKQLKCIRVRVEPGIQLPKLRRVMGHAL